MMAGGICGGRFSSSDGRLSSLSEEWRNTCEEFRCGKLRADCVLKGSLSRISSSVDVRLEDSPLLRELCFAEALEEVRLSKLF